MDFDYPMKLRKTFSGLLFLAFLTALSSCSDANEPSEIAETKQVVLFQYADSPLHEGAIGGMIEGLAGKGFIDGQTLHLTRYNAGRNPETSAEISNQIANGRFDLVLTSGTPALQAMALANQGGTTVQVFGVVANPFRAEVGLDENDPGNHPDNLVGVASFPPVVPVFHLIKEINPDLKVVGVVWNPAEVNSVEGIERAFGIADELGIELLEATAETVEGVSDAAKRLVAEGAEILWIGPDNTAHHAADMVIAAAKEGGIPVISSLPGDAERGALFDLSYDWHEVGKTVGAMAGDILAGADPSTIPVAIHSEALMLVLNENALVGLKSPWSFPDEVLARADEIIGVNK